LKTEVFLGIVKALEQCSYVQSALLFHKIHDTIGTLEPISNKEYQLTWEVFWFSNDYTNSGL